MIMKRNKKIILLAACSMIALIVLGGWMIWAEWSHTPIYRSGDTYILRDTYNNHMGTISLKNAERIYKNQSGLYEVWQYEDNEVGDLLEALAWRQNDMADENEAAQFAISFSGAEDSYLPMDRMIETYYFCTENNRTHDYVHLYFYPEVTLGKGETMQYVLLIMREY